MTGAGRYQIIVKALSSPCASRTMIFSSTSFTPARFYSKPSLHVETYPYGYKCTLGIGQRSMAMGPSKHISAVEVPLLAGDLPNRQIRSAVQAFTPLHFSTRKSNSCRFYEAAGYRLEHGKQKEMHFVGANPVQVRYRKLRWTTSNPRVCVASHMD